MEQVVNNIEKELDNVNDIDFNEYLFWRNSQLSVDKIRLSNFNNLPQLFNYKEELNYIINSNIISQEIIDNFDISILKKDILEDLAYKIFWRIFITKLCNDNYQSLNNEIKEYIKKTILNLKLIMNNILNNKERDKIIILIQFLLGYLFLFIFSKLFVNDNNIINLRFCFDVFHLIVLDFQGLYVTDSYIKTNINNIFTSTAFNFFKKKDTSSKSYVFEDLMQKNRHNIITKNISNIKRR